VSAPMPRSDLELREHAVDRLSHAFELDRRRFFQVLGGGLLVCLSVRSVLAQESGHTHGGQSEDDLPNDIAAWLHINEHGDVTVYTGKAEMGQNIRTSLSQQVAEELRMPVSKISLVMGDTDLTPYDMGTFGSRTTPIMGRRLRIIASTARVALVEMGAVRWHTAASQLVAKDGTVINSSSQQVITYGELTRGQQITKIAGDDSAATPATQWQVAGAALPKVDGAAFVTGKHKYASDITRPGLLHGKVIRPDAYNAKLVSVNTAEAEKLPSVKVVRDGDFIGLTASNSAIAEQALGAVKAEWQAPQQPSDGELFQYLRTHSDSQKEGTKQVVGSVAKGLASAHKVLSQTYTVAYIAHSPLEPRAAVAEWAGDKLTVWTGTQRPFAAREELAQAFRMPVETVRVIVPDTGSAYGGKHTGETAVEAARLAKAAGRPVRLVWTREEEFTWAYFRPAGVIDLKSGVSADGKVVSWEYDNYNSGPAAISTPYDIPNQRIEFHPSQSPLRQGSYRGLAASANHFARESHMDELAHAVSLDPLEFRLKNLSNPRLRAVFQAAADNFGWGKQKSSPQRGFGMAGGIEKGGHVASFAEVEIGQEGDSKSRTVHIRRVVEAFECGAVVNPEGLRNQIQGAIVQAIGGALFEAIRFQNGRISNPHFSEYRVPRFKDVPEIEVVILDRKDLPSAGAGETPIVGLAPAVGNAIFNATGIRLRSLPMVPHGLTSST
jgi:CO/xanthine dehydrogenase Mo-binding subunit